MRTSPRAFAPQGNPFDVFDEEEERARAESLGLGGPQPMAAPQGFEPPPLELPQEDFGAPPSPDDERVPVENPIDEDPLLSLAPPDPEDERQVVEGSRQQAAQGALEDQRSARANAGNSANLDQGIVQALLSGGAGILDIALNKGKGLGQIAMGATQAEANRVAGNEKIRQFDVEQAAQEATGERRAKYEDAQMRNWESLQGDRQNRGGIGQERLELSQQAAAARAAEADPESDISLRMQKTAAELGMGDMSGRSAKEIRAFMTSLNANKRLNDAPQIADNAGKQAAIVKDAQQDTEHTNAPRTAADAADQADKVGRAGAGVRLETEPGIVAATTGARGAAEAATPEAIAKRTAAIQGAESDFSKTNEKKLAAYKSLQDIGASPRNPDGSIQGFSPGEQLEERIPYGGKIVDFFGGKPNTPAAQNNISKMLQAANDIQRDDSGAAGPLKEAAGFFTRTFGNEGKSPAEREAAMMSFQRRLAEELRASGSNQEAARAVTGRMGIKGVFDDPKSDPLMDLAASSEKPPQDAAFGASPEGGAPEEQVQQIEIQGPSGAWIPMELTGPEIEKLKRKQAKFRVAGGG